MSFTAQELYEALGATSRFDGGRIHWAESPRFAGTPGHLYLYRRPTRVSSADLAAISHRSGDVEVCLMRMDGLPLVYVSHGGLAVATVFVPDRESGMESFEWVAHTHPLEMETPEEGVARGPTRADREALERIHERWGQSSSTMVLCRRGAVVREVTFEIERDRRAPAGGGPLWHPTD